MELFYLKFKKHIRDQRINITWQKGEEKALVAETAGCYCKYLYVFEVYKALASTYLIFSTSSCMYLYLYSHFTSEITDSD